MNTLREEIIKRSPKVFSNFALALLFWLIRFVVLVVLDSINVEFVFLLQMGLLIVTGIFFSSRIF